MKYELLEKDRARYVSLILLNEIINFQTYFPVRLVGDQVFLTNYLESMEAKQLLRIERGVYVPTELGRQELVSLYERYSEFLRMFDIFSAVDLEAGEFAFSRMFEDFSNDEWEDFINQERFSDVRIAVAEFKGINPIEFVFLSFLNENRFDLTLPRWEYNLTGNEVWNEILEICETAISMEYLSQDGVLEDVIRQGSAIAIDLVKQAKEIEDSIYDKLDSFGGEEEVIEEVIETDYVEIVDMPVYGYDYWDSYYDPYYVSPIWLVPILLW